MILDDALLSQEIDVLQPIDGVAYDCDPCKRSVFSVKLAQMRIRFDVFFCNVGVRNEVHSGLIDSLGHCPLELKRRCELRRIGLALGVHGLRARVD